MENIKECPICSSNAEFYVDRIQNMVFYNCPLCGRFELNANASCHLDRNKLSSYLLYNGFKDKTIEHRYHTVLSKELCDKYRQEFDQGNNTNGRPVHMDDQIIDNWYPKTFSDRIDHILLYLNSRIKHVGQKFSMDKNELLGALFIDRFDYGESSKPSGFEHPSRKTEDCSAELKYILDYLASCDFITYQPSWNQENGTWAYVSISPGGYMRIDELQKNTANGNNVLVAMQFGNDTMPLREAIRQGIRDAKYNAIFIDEVQHNDFITPELLKYIRNSKFVVVDLTHRNNGAYFEEGYAMGLGKPVIQLCKSGTTLHFDIAQKNTIMWDAEEDIPQMLTNRIKATID